jgi:ribosomal protein S6--L-glutamate ligase
LEKMHEQQRDVLIQEFIGEANGKDIRVIVAGGKCIAAMERQAAVGEFRANLHLGGQATPLTLDKETAALAVRAARVHGLEVAGVDLIPSRRGPLVLEVNSSPGLEGIEQTTGVDVAGAMIALLERKVGRGKQGKKRQAK